MASSIIADVGLLGAMIRELHKALVKPAEEMAAINLGFLHGWVPSASRHRCPLVFSDCWKSSVVNLWNSNAYHHIYKRPQGNQGSSLPHRDSDLQARFVLPGESNL